MTHSHIRCTKDPITGRDISDPTGHPYVVEGDQHHDITIYFENEQTKQEYLEIPVEHPETELSHSLDNPTDIMIDEG